MSYDRVTVAAAEGPFFFFAFAADSPGVQPSLNPAALTPTCAGGHILGSDLFVEHVASSTGFPAAAVGTHTHTRLPVDRHATPKDFAA